MKHLIPCLVTLTLLSACSGSGVDIPAVTTSGQDRLPGKIIWHDLITDTPAQSRRFYGELFGWEFESLPGGINYTLIKHRGRAIGGLVDQTRLSNPVDISQWVVALSVADVRQAAATVATAGGEVLTPPTSLGRRGEIAVVTDPAGALLALLQTDADPPDAGVAAPGDFLWNELWVPDTANAAAFYQQLAPLQVDAEDLAAVPDQIDYRILQTGPVPRSGIRRTPDEVSGSRWVSYLRVTDRAQLEALLARVEGLGGRIIVPATERPAGGSLAIITGPSGAGIALQTWGEQHAGEI